MTLPLDEVLREIQHLRGTDTPANIARRLGVQPKSLARRLRRHGHYELALLFEAAQRQETAA